ncbi:MAG: hypothetical protein ABL951_11660 [Alphaproteobacteria bacterium]
MESLWQFWESVVGDLSWPGGIDGGFLQSLNNPVTSRFSAGILLLLATGSLIWFVMRRIWPAHRMILMASRAVEGTADQVAFTASFPRFDRAINEIALLRRPWAQFRIGVIVPPQSARAPIRHHLRAGDYLHLEALEAGGFNFRFFRLWSGFFFAAGVLLSLLGITLDIHLTSLAYDSDPGAWDGFIDGLAGNLLPMLTGFGSALALAVGFHWAEHRLKRDLHLLSHALEDRIKFSMVRPAADQYTQLRGPVAAPEEVPVELSALPEQLRTLSQEIVAALARVETQMTETMPGRIGDAMTPLSDALDLLGKRLSESNAEALRQAVGELSQGLHERAIEDLDSLSGALVQARSGLEDAGLALRDASTHASEKLTDAGEALAEQIGRASHNAQQAFGPLPLRIAEFGDVLERFNAGLSRHEDAVASAAGTAHRAISVMDEILARPREMATAPVYAALAPPQTPVLEIMVVEDLSRAARDMSLSVEAVLDARRLLKRLSSRLRQPATSLITEDWAQHREMLSGSDEMLSEVLENFRTSANQQRAGLDTAVEELETRLERLFRDLDAGASRLDSAIHSMRRHALIAAVPAQGAAPGADESTDAA